MIRSRSISDQYEAECLISSHRSLFLLSTKQPPIVRGQSCRDRLYEKTVSKGSRSCHSRTRQGVPTGFGTLTVTSATCLSKPSFTGSSNSIKRCFPPIWPSRAGACPRMCSANSRTISNAAVWSMALFRASCPPPLRGQPTAVQIRSRRICLRVRCDTCHAEHLVAFSCKRRGFCPSCGARRMAESAALLVDEILPEQPVRQWVLSFPYPLRFLFATRPTIMGQVLGIVYRVIATHLVRKAGLTKMTARTGVVTLIQRFGSALNLNVLCGAPHKIFHVKSCVMWSDVFTPLWISQY